MTTSKSDTAANAADNIREKAAEAKQAAGDQAVRTAEGAKFSLADEMSSVASALKVASREFDGESAGSKAFTQVAESLSGASEAIRQKGVGEMISDLNSFARRNPAAFLGAAAVLGFAASRFARASATTETPNHGGPAAASTKGVGPRTTAERPGWEGGS